MEIPVRELRRMEIDAIFAAHDKLDNRIRDQIDDLAIRLSRRLGIRIDEAVYLLAKIGMDECRTETPSQV